MLFMTSGPFPSPIFKRQLLALESRCFQIIFNCLINEYRRNGALGVLLLGPREVPGGGSKRGPRGAQMTIGKNPLGSTGDLLELLDFFSKFY